MVNLLGCNKQDFIKLLELMNYKTEKINKDKEIYFSYMPKKAEKKKKFVSKNKKSDNPFNILNSLNFN